MCGSKMAPVVLAVLLLLSSSPLSHAFLSAPTVEGAKSSFIQAKDGSFGSLEDTYYAISSLVIGAKSPASYALTCTFIDSLKGTSLDASSAFWKLSIASSLACSSFSSIAEEAEEIFLASSASSSLKEILFVSKGLELLKSKGASKKAGDYHAVAKNLFSTIQSLSEEDGSWKLSKDSSTTSAVAAGLALEAYASLHFLGVPVQDSLAPIKRDISSLFASGVSSKDESENSVFFFEGSLAEGGSLAATSTIISGYITLASALGDDLDVKGALVVGSAKFLATAGVPGSASEAFHVLSALSKLDSNPIVIPALLSIPSKLTLGSSPVALQVQATSVLGTPVDVSVNLLSFGKPRGKTPLVSNKPLLSNGKGIFSAEILPADADLGRFVAKLEVKGKEGSKVAGGVFSQLVRVGTSISVADATVSILDSDASRPEAEAKYTLGLESTASTLPATHLQKILITISLSTPSGKTFVPHQAFLKLVHESGREHRFSLQPSGSKLSLSIALLESMAKFYYLSGIYSIEATFGDAAIENSFTWSLGAVDLDFPNAPESAPKPPSPRPPLAKRFEPKAEISHIFRSPEKRPPLLVSYAFVGVALLPLLIFLFGLVKLGVNFKAFPTTGLSSILALLFHLGIASILLLYAAFWIKVNLFVTLKLLVVLGALTCIPGYKTLSYLAQSSAKVKSA